MRQVDIKLPAKLATLFQGQARYRGAYGGRGSGKSEGFAMMAIMRMLQRKGKYLFCRELQNSIKDSVHSVLVNMVDRLGLQDCFEYGESFFRCKVNGSEAMFKGLRTNAAEIKSMHGIVLAWVEEAQGVSQKSLDLLLPTVREAGSEIWFTWNPLEDVDPVHVMLVTNRPDNAMVCKVNWNDNPWFPDVLDQERLRCLQYQPQRYDWIWNGNFNTNTEAAVYGKWIANAEREGRICTGVYDPKLPVHTAWDLGFSDDTSIWWWQQLGNEIRFIDYYENNRHSLKHYAEQIYGCEIIIDEYGDNGIVLKWHKGEVINERRSRYRYMDGSHYVPHDAANKLLQAGGRSTVDQLYELGVKTRVVNATSQQNQIEALRTTLMKSWFDLDYTKDGIRCLRKYAYVFDEERNKYSDKPNHDAFSHGADSAEIVGQVWQSKVQSTPVNKPRFLQDLTAKEVFALDKPATHSDERI